MRGSWLSSSTPGFNPQYHGTKKKTQQFKQVRRFDMIDHTEKIVLIVQNIKQQRRTVIQLLNHHVIFLDYNFQSSLFNSCSSLIGCLWVMLLTFAPIFEKSFRLHMWKQMVFFLESLRSNIYACSSGRDDITPHNNITSPLSKGMSHPDSQLQISR